MNIYLDDEQKYVFLELLHIMKKQLSKEISKLDKQLDAPMFPVQRKQLKQQKKKYQSMQSLCVLLGDEIERNK